jgi:hypothetical protein
MVALSVMTFAYALKSMQKTRITVIIPLFLLLIYNCINLSIAGTLASIFEITTVITTIIIFESAHGTGKIIQ